MKTVSRYLSPAAGPLGLVGVILAIAGLPLSADTITTIDLSTDCGGTCYNGSWSGELNGAAVQAGAESGTGSTGSGLTFSDPTGQYDEVGWDTSQTFTTNILLNGNSSIESLMNMFFGNSTTDFTEATLVATNSLGQTETYDLDSEDTIRDYNNDGFADFLSGSNPSNPGGTVTAVSWWNTGDAASNSNDEPSQRLDAQTFALPSSWAGTDLTSVEIEVGYDGSFPVGDVALSALQVANGSGISPVPEPASVSLLMAALLGMGLVARGMRRRSES